MGILARFALGIGAAAALLAGCGALRQAQDDMQPPIAAPNAMPLGHSIVTDAKHRGSWMLPEAKSEDLIYLSGYVFSGATVYVYAYRSGKLVGMLTGFRNAQGLCANQSGDVFVTELHGQDIVEYGHAGVKPKARLRDTGYAPNGCDVDPTTGDLAVANYCGKSVSDCVGSNTGDLVIYHRARGYPQAYSNPAIATYLFCGYDDQGNVYVVGGGAPGYPGYEFAELGKRGISLHRVILDQTISGSAGVQWDGSHVAVGDSLSRIIYQFVIKGNKGTKVGSTQLVNTSFGQFWIKHNRVLSTDATYYKSWVQFFDYPAGGHYARRFHAYRAIGITVSRAGL